MGAIIVAVGPAAWAQPTVEAVRASDCGHELTGRIVDADLDAPIVDALVASESLDGIVRTDADGRFVMPGLCAGSVSVTVSKQGFAPGRVTVSVPSATPVLIRLTFAMQSVTITAPLDDPLNHLGLSDVIEGLDLAETRGLSLGEALSRVDGVQILRSGAVTKPVIDGFYGNRILIINDGLRHHAQLWALDHAPEIDPFSAHRLTVVRGADGVRYGADAIGGTILVEPVPFTDPGDAGVTGEGNLVGISNGRQGIANLQLVGTVPGMDRLSVRAQGSFKKAGSLGAPDYALDNTGSEDIAATVAVRYLGRGWEATVGGSHFRTKYGIFTGLRAGSLRDYEEAIALDRPANADLFEFSYGVDRAFSKVDHSYAHAGFRIELGPGATVAARYGFQRNDRREFDVRRRPTTRPQLTLLLDSHALELTLEHQWGPRWQGLVGLSGLQQSNDHGGTRLIPDYERLMGGVFAVQRYTDDGFQISAGIRYERQGMSTEQPARVNPNSAPPERSELDFDAFMATVGLTLDPNPAWQFDLHLAYATRIPTLDELFLDGTLPGEAYVITGDRTLNPERTLNAGLGMAYAHRWLDAEVTAYVHRIDDYIYRAPRLDENGELDFELTLTGERPALEYRNVDALYAGGSVSVDLHPFAWVSWRSSAAYVRARNIRDDTFLVNIPQDRYENRLTFNMPDVSLFRQTQLWFESVIVRRQQEFDANADFDDPPDGYHVVNTGLTTTFLVGPQEVRASIDLQNLLNATYRDYLSRLRFFGDEPGFSAIARLSLPFGVSFDRREENRPQATE